MGGALPNPGGFASGARRSRKERQEPKTIRTKYSLMRQSDNFSKKKNVSVGGWGGGYMEGLG